MKVHVPWKVALLYAELLKMKMPIQVCLCLMTISYFRVTKYLFRMYTIVYADRRPGYNMSCVVLVEEGFMPDLSYPS